MMRKLAALVAASVGLLLPFSALLPTALAAPVDVSSMHVALRGLDRYLKQQVSTIPTGRRDDRAFVASVSSRCRNVLAAYAKLPASQVNTGAAFTFGQEAGADVVVVAYAANRTPFAKLNRTLSGLSWSRKRKKATVKRLLASEHAVLSLAPSDICSDARALAANPQATPPATLRWLAGVVRANDADIRAVSAFSSAAARLATPADVPVLTDIVRVSNRIASAQGALAKAEGRKLLRALGVSP
jgi:hypothetical protein